MSFDMTMDKSRMESRDRKCSLSVHDRIVEVHCGIDVLLKYRAGSAEGWHDDLKQAGLLRNIECLICSSGI